MKKNLFEMGADFDDAWSSDNKDKPAKKISTETRPPEKHQLYFSKEKRRGKVVSHWAKAYRGIVLREIAKAGIETLEDFIKLPIEGLTIKEIQTKKNKTEIIYEIG